QHVDSWRSVWLQMRSLCRRWRLPSRCCPVIISFDVVTRLGPLWYHRGMDVSVKVLEPEVIARLAEQAEREGVSAQEWMRQALRRTAALLTPQELSDRVGARAPV